MAGTGRKVWAADEVLAAADLQSYIQDQVVFVYANASARSSGILSPTEGMVSYLSDTNLLYAFDGSSWIEIAPDVGTAGTYTKVTTDAKGRVTSGTTLAEADIPALGAAKTTSGIFDAARIPGLDGSKIVSGLVADAYITKTGQWTGQIVNSQANQLGSLGLTGGISAGGGIASTGGNVTAAGDLVSYVNVYGVNTYNQTNVPARAMYVNAAGLFGIGSSSRKFKENIVDAGLDTDAILQLAVRRFNYKKEFDADQSEMIGVIAEELVELGLDEFVHFDSEGEPEAVAYDKLALAALAVLRVQAERMDLFEARLNKLEK